MYIYIYILLNKGRLELVIVTRISSVSVFFESKYKNTIHEYKLLHNYKFNTITVLLIIYLSFVRIQYRV